MRTGLSVLGNLRPFLFPVVGMVVMIGSSNAVNLTDGLDGLAIVPTERPARNCFHSGFLGLL